MVLLGLVVCSLITFAVATDVQQCPGQSFNELNKNVVLTPCARTPCRLKKGNNMHIKMTFTTDRKIKEITNHVTADVFGVELPFIGVDGNSICDKLETEAGEKASCPLEAGITYVYVDSFHVHTFYPSIDVKVHWALMDGNNNIMCFQVPAKIVK